MCNCWISGISYSARKTTYQIILVADCKRTVKVGALTVSRLFCDSLFFALINHDYIDIKKWYRIFFSHPGATINRRVCNIHRIGNVHEIDLFSNNTEDNID